MDAFIFITTSVTFVMLPMMLCHMVMVRYFKHREKNLEFQAPSAATLNVQYSSSNAKFEQCLRGLEQLVTDCGTNTTAQVDALSSRVGARNLGHQPNR